MQCMNACSGCAPRGIKYIHAKIAEADWRLYAGYEIVNGLSEDNLSTKQRAV